MPIAQTPALDGLGWVASPIVINLVDKSISYLGTDIIRDLDDLVTTLMPQFQLIIQAAQHQPPHAIARLEKWLARLKNAYFDAEAILHELEYEHLKRKAKGEDKKLLVRLSSKPIIKPLAKFTDRAVRKASLLSPQKKKLLTRLNKLKEIAVEAKMFHDLLGIQKTERKDERKDAIIAHFPSSSMRIDKMFGRNEKCEEIIDFLLDKRGGSRLKKSYSVVAVTGIGGAGKTTFARFVYNNLSIKQQFPIRIWLSLSGNLDIIEHTKEMIQCASKKECPNLRNLDSLQHKLIETLLESVTILVVLDNVWHDNNDIAGENQWENLLKPFSIFVSRGGTCKIMVTSHSLKLLPFALQPAKFIELGDLAFNDFKSLLMYCAGMEFTNFGMKNPLDQFAVKMCKLPLVAKIVGKRLSEQPYISFWQDTIERVNLSSILDILLWSFRLLDVQLQRCFLFCSIFPKGTRHFGLRALVPYWVALDFIQPSDDRNVEDIGLQYLKIMVENSIFNLVDETYIMHDLFHDLAEMLSQEDCFRVTNAEREIPSSVQHVFLHVNNENLKDKISSICNLSNLRTLILGSPFIDDISEIIPMISTYFRNLRVLHIMSRGYETLPSVVGDFRNLRLLGLLKSSIEELPDSVLQLYHLQFLWLPSSVKVLPTKLRNLINLRRIEMYNSDGRQVKTLPPIPCIGKLTSLQGLDEFHVKKEEGYELQQLEHLKEIGGSLRIVNLENVRDKYEAVKARLIDKFKLEKLELVWAESAENGTEIEVIEALRPPRNLMLLAINGYRGSKNPTWLQEGSIGNNIEDVRFYNCNALKELPTFPATLVRLSIIKFPCLIFACENELQVNENQSIMESQFLRHDVEGCKDILDHELKSFKQTGSVENCGEQLKIIESIVQGNKRHLSVDVNRAWWHCHQQRMNFIFRCNTRANKLELPFMLRNLNLGYCCVSDGALSDCLKGMTNLEELYLEGIMTLTTLPPVEVMESLRNLQVLGIIHCWYLRSLGGLQAVPYLQRFQVESCLCLKMNSKAFNKFSTLEFIGIIDCPEILGLPELPSSVQHIRIRGCPVLRERCQPNGPDWDNIQCIQHRKIE